MRSGSRRHSSIITRVRVAVTLRERSRRYLNDFMRRLRDSVSLNAPVPASPLEVDICVTVNATSGTSDSIAGQRLALLSIRAAER